MYRFCFVGSAIYYGYNIVGGFEYKNNEYIVRYKTLKNSIKTISAKTKKEIRKELLTDCKRYK